MSETTGLLALVLRLWSGDGPDRNSLGNVRPDKVDDWTDRLPEDEARALNAALSRHVGSRPWLHQVTDEP